jgi:hypothetical protein
MGRNRDKKRSRAALRFERRLQYEATLILHGWECIRFTGREKCAGVHHIRTGYVAWRTSDGQYIFDKPPRNWKGEQAPFSRLTNGFFWALIGWLHRRDGWQGEPK